MCTYFSPLQYKYTLRWYFINNIISVYLLFSIQYKYTVRWYFIKNIIFMYLLFSSTVQVHCTLIFHLRYHICVTRRLATYYKPATTRSDNHCRVVLVPWKKWTCPVYATVHWTSHFLQGTRYTRPCIIGHPVSKPQRFFCFLKPSVYIIKQSQDMVYLNLNSIKI